MSHETTQIIFLETAESCSAGKLLRGKGTHSAAVYPPLRSAPSPVRLPIADARAAAALARVAPPHFPTRLDDDLAVSRNPSKINFSANGQREHTRGGLISNV